MKILLAIIAVMVSFTCQGKLTVFRGQHVRHQQFPFMALLGAPSSFCSGALISRRSVVTAGHCICPINSMNTVYFGRDSAYSGAKPYPIVGKFNVPEYDIICDRFKRDPTFDTISGADLAVVTLFNDPLLRGDAKLVALELDREPGFGTRVLTLGYGRDKTASADVINKPVLKLGHVTITECLKDFDLHLSPICVRKSMTNVQVVDKGDSGGPLLEERTNRVLGVVSGGIDVGHSFYTTYARLKTFKSFIQEFLDY